MINLVTLLLCFVIGIVLRYAGRLPTDAHKTLNAFIINVALPALILRYVHELRYDAHLILPAIMPWVMFVCGAGFFSCVGRFTGWSRATTGGLMLSGGLANTSFVGLPMIEAFYGPAYLGVGILVDQLGTYMVLSTLGVMVAMFCAQVGRMTPAALTRKVLTFPPFQAMLLALALIPIEYSATTIAVLDRIGGTLTPLALVSVGYQLRVGELRGTWLALSAGLFFKLILGPAMVALLLVFVVHAAGKVTQVTIFEAAMGPQIGGAIVAMEHGLDPRLVGLMVGFGIPLSLITAAVWSYLLAAV